MNVKKRRIMSVFIVLILIATMIAACGKSSSNSSSDGGATKPAAEQGKDGGSKKELSTLQDIAMYEGADRQQLLIEGAKKEGSLNLYTSMNQASAEKLKDDFGKKYGVKVNIWRASSEDVLQRTLTETQGGRFEVDVIETNGPELEAMHREKIIQEVKSPFLKDLIPQAITSHKEWVSTRLNVFVQEYNTQKVKQGDLPKTYEDLLDPKWKGKLSIESSDFNWFLTVVKEMGEEKGIQYFKNLVATNGLTVRKGHALLAELVSSAEEPFALTVYSYKAEQDKKAGKPVDWFNIGPVIAQPNGMAIPKKVAHPFAAVLFYDYIISDAQKILATLDFVPVSKNEDSPLKGKEIRMIDSATMLDETEKWSKLYDDIVVKRK